MSLFLMDPHRKRVFMIFYLSCPIFITFYLHNKRTAEINMLLLISQRIEKIVVSLLGYTIWILDNDTRIWILGSAALKYEGSRQHF